MYDGLTPLQGDVTAGDLTQLLQAGDARPRRREGRRDVSAEGGRDDLPRLVRRAARLREDARGHRVRRGLGDGGGSRPLPAAAARRRRASRRSTSPATTRSPSRSRRAPSSRARRPRRSSPRRRSSRAQTARGRQLLKDVDAYIAGINAYFLKAGGFVDAVHAQRRHRDRHADRRGVRRGRRQRGAQRAVPLRAAAAARRGEGPRGLERPARAHGPARRRSPSRRRSRTTTADRDRRRQRHDRRGQLRSRSSRAPVPLQHRQLMSNALLVGAKRSANGHPIFVAGPQVGYYSPGDPDGARPARRRAQRARRRLPGARLLPPDRPRAGLRVERDVRELRRDRRVRRDALRQRRRRSTSTRASAATWARSTPAR